MRFSLVSASRSGFSDAFKVPTYREMQPQLVVELRRARRYEHPLGVAMLSLQAPLGSNGTRGNGHEPGAHAGDLPAAYGLLGAYVRNTLRETDILTGMPESLAYVAFLPGVDRPCAERALHRLRDGFLECAGFDIRGGVAGFPSDGLTLEDVIDRAREAWRQACRPGITLTAEPRYLHG